MNDVMPPGIQVPNGPAMPPDGPLVLFARVLERAPGYLSKFLIGLLEACLSDTVTTALLFASIALALCLGVAAGVSAFFFVYVICRVVGNIAAAIGAGAGAGNQLAAQVARFHQPPQT